MKANPPYQDPQARHGPCYVLDPAEWNKGNRAIIEVIPAKNPRIRPHYDPPEVPVRPSETKRVVTWDKGRAHDFRFENVPVKRTEPRWAARARELKAAGWAERRIMKELGLKSKRYFAEVLHR